MREHDGRTDPVEQCRAGVLVALLRLLVGDNRLDLRCIERIEDRVALAPFVRSVARPLRVFLGLRPSACGLDCSELKLFVRRREHAGRAIAGVPGGAPAHWLVDHVDHVALLDEIFSPALAPVRRSHPVRCCLRGPMDQDQRIGLAHILRGQHLHIGLPLHDLLAGLARIFAADVEITALGDGGLIDGGDRQLGRLGPRSQHTDGRERDTCGGPQHRTGHGFLPAALFTPRHWSCLTREREPAGGGLSMRRPTTPQWRVPAIF